MRNFILSLCLLATSPVFAENPDSAKFYFNKGVEEQTARRFLMAANAFDKAIKFDPKFKDAYLQNGYVNLEMRKTDNAITYFSKVLDLEPGNATAVKELAELYFNYRQFNKAMELAQKCPTCPNAEKIIAISNFHLENFELAVKGLLSFLKKNPADAESNYMVASSYLGMEQNPEAAKYYQKAIELDPTRVNWMNELGILYYEMNNFKSAVVYFNLAKEKGFPQSSSFIENLAYSYVYSGDFATGEKMLLELWAKKPGNKDILRDLADAYYQRKQYDKSLEFCQKLLEMDMKDAKAMYQAGMCFQKKGDKDRGMGLCDKAIEIDPSLASMRKQQMMGAGL